MSWQNSSAQQSRKKERLLDAGSDEIITQTQELLDILDAGPDFLECFDEELFCELVDKIIVESNERLWFRLKNGLELPEAIEDSTVIWETESSHLATKCSSGRLWCSHRRPGWYSTFSAVHSGGILPGVGECLAKSGSFL